MILEAKKVIKVHTSILQENNQKMSLKILVTNLIIPLLILQGVSSEHYDFSSGVSNYQKLDIEGNYSYLASKCRGEIFFD